MKRKLLLVLILVLSSFLRLYSLDKFPPSLYTDEANQGYNAYSILKTGKDEHGSFLPISLRSFGDWKPPLQTYLMIPFIRMFGLNEIAVRLPSAILGILVSLVTYLLIFEIFRDRKKNTKIALLSAFLISISPWVILQSRSAMLVMVALFTLVGGVLFFLKSIKNIRYLSISLIFFCLSVYSYYGMRVITPLLVVILFILFRKSLVGSLRIYILPFLLLLIFVAPLLLSFVKNPDVVFGRARTVSIFYDQGIKLRQWELISQDGITANPVISRFFHNNLNMYGSDIIKRFLSHFEYKFLFTTGDKSPPFQIPGMGIIYLIDGIYIIIGIYHLLKSKGNVKFILLAWIFISIIPASLTFMTPSANRTFSAAVPYAILTSIGIGNILYGKIIHRYLFLVVVCTSYVLSFAYFLNQYFLVLPIDYADRWIYGWKEAVKYTNSISNKYDNIYISDKNGMPYIYYLFYNKYDPEKFQKEAVRTYSSDNFGFEHVEGFDKYIFTKEAEWKDMKENRQERTLYIVPANQTELHELGLKVIFYPNGKQAIKFFEK
jgi:4-amino-4-deoxy-L-arabinose transferase-like glycosyltransferase